MHQIHDKGYRRLFKNKGIFRQLLETFVKKGWVKDLDFATCETLDKSFIADHYKETISDIIHRLKLKHTEIFIVILTEFKSTVERFTSLDMAHYVASFYKDYVESNKNVRMLPPVFPILLYNGNAEWTAPTRLSDLIEGREYVGEPALNFEYYKIAINEYQKDDLLKIKNVVSLLFLAEAHYDAELLQQEFLKVFEKEEDKGPISLLLNWFIQLRRHGRIPDEDVAQLERIYESKEEVQTMLITALEKEKREIYEKSKEEVRAMLITALEKEKQETYDRGLFDGEIKGEIKYKNVSVRKMLAKGFDLPLIAELTGLTAEAILQIKQEMQN